MAGNLKMTTSELTAAKGNISRDNELLGESIQAIYDAIRALTQSSWQGDAAKEADAQIEAFYKKTYGAFKDAVNGYVQFIEETATRYDEVEDALKGNAATSMDNSALAQFN